MVIVDTTVWIDYLAGKTNAQTAWLEIHADRQRLGLTDLILCEILQGIRTEADVKKVRHELSRFAIFSTVGEDLAVASAQNYRTLRRRGITVRTTIDCFIATYCLREGHSLLHHDSDFNPFETHLGLQVIHPVT
ncbi:MAG TPA: PIN domain nuclease [Granulicella sp.]|jgi:hypothetical protein